MLPVLFSCAMQNEATQQDAALSVEMLESQKLMLEQYSLRLSEMLESQDQINQQVEVLQLDVKQVNKLVVGELKALRDLYAQQATKTKSQAVTKSKDDSADDLLSLQKTVLGRYEWLWFDLLSDNLKARIDTGVLSSFLAVSKIQPFERNSESWVSFSVPELGGTKTYEMPVQRFARVRTSADEEDTKRRPVVTFVVRLGDLTEEAEFTLEQKEDPSYPVQLGRNFLRDIALVDVSKKYTQKKYTPSAANSVALP